MENRYFYIKVTYVTEKQDANMDLGFKIVTGNNLNKKEIKEHIENTNGVKISSLFLDNIHEFNNEKEYLDFWVE